MAFTDVFGGELLFPSQLSYLSITTAVDITLQWPTEQQITGDNVVADFLDIDATAASINITMPSASVTSTGNKTSISNVGFNDFDVLDNTGGPIQTIEPGDVWVIVLTDNTTVAGLWSTFQLGATVSVASAAALAGAGIKSIGVLLNQKIDSDVEASTPITVVNGDRAKCLIFTGGAGQADLPDPGVVGDDWFFMLRNSGTGSLAVVPPSGQIDGSADITLEPNSSTFIFTDGTDFFTIGFTQSATIGFDFVSIPVPGSGDFVLAGANLNRISYRFTGALTGDRRIVVPNTTQQYWCDNQTTGAFSLTISTNAQVSPPELEQGETAIFYCDIVDVIVAVNATTISLPLSVVQGGTGANNPVDARNNLEAAHDELDMIAGDGLIGGGLLQADLTFTVGAGTGIGVNADDIELDYSGISVEVPAAGDFITFQDIDDADNIKKVTVADLSGEPQQLFDSASNVRVSAELLGVAQLRSDANVDAEVRLLEFAHSDGTPVGLVGQPTASIDFRIANLIIGGDIIAIPGAPGGEFIVDIGGVPALTVQNASTQFQGTLDNNAIVFWNDTGGLNRASLGFATSDAFLFRNQLDNPGVAFRFQGEDSATITRTMLEMNPNDGPHLFESGDEVARVVPAVDGGLEINNLDTGAGFERALTTADLSAAAAFRGVKAFKTGTDNWPLNNTPGFPAVPIPGVAEAAQVFNANVWDTEAGAIHDPIGPFPTRFFVPAGVSRVRITGGYGIQGNTSGGYRHVRIRRNGTGAPTDPSQPGYIYHQTNTAAGSGSFWGSYISTGIITVIPGDYYEFYVLRQNSSGLTVSSSVWMAMEIIE
jgi:hypothetical protein